MTDEAMNPLRRRMIEDMAIRKLAPKTQQGYIRAVKDFATFLGRSPDTAGCIAFRDAGPGLLHFSSWGFGFQINDQATATHSEPDQRIFQRHDRSRSENT
jgi:integrase/recombinase XerD